MQLCPSAIKECFEQGVIISDKPYDYLLEKGRIQPNSIDLSLGNTFCYRDTSAKEWVCKKVDAGYIKLEPHATVLAHTAEYIGTSTLKYKGKHVTFGVQGKSTLGRHFIEIHQTAGFGDIGYSGFITLEIKNNTHEPVYLALGEPICQIYFTMCEGDIIGNGYTQGSYSSKELKLVPKRDMFEEPDGVIEVF